MVYSYYRDVYLLVLLCLSRESCNTMDFFALMHSLFLYIIEINQPGSDLSCIHGGKKSAPQYSIPTVGSCNSLHTLIIMMIKKKERKKERKRKPTKR
jgi:hypothetical protein